MDITDDWDTSEDAMAEQELAADADPLDRILSLEPGLDEQALDRIDAVSDAAFAEIIAAFRLEFPKEYIAGPPPSHTTTLPGTERRIEILAARAERGWSLFRPDDCPSETYVRIVKVLANGEHKRLGAVDERRRQHEAN